MDRLSRTVHFSNIQVNKLNFPSSPDKAPWYQDGFQKMVAGGVSTMSLDRLQAMLSIENALKMGRSVPVKNDPPKSYSRREPPSSLPSTASRSGAP